MQTIPFVKMSGLGNDFVVIDAINSNLQPELSLIKAIADRHLGVGCDQVLWLSQQADKLLYRIFNPDGSEVAQCGNGARCIGYYMQQVHAYSAWPLMLHTCAGKVLQVEPIAGDLFRVAMGQATAIVSDSMVDFQGRSLEFIALDVGNPHAIFWLSEDIADFALDSLGELMQGHTTFLQGVNVSVVNRVDESRVKARVFERGAGETMACGSAACAIAAAGFAEDKCSGEVVVMMPGGELRVCQQADNLYQTGPVSWVFVGTWCHRQQSSEMFYFDVT